jgi:hypothetical protein
MITSPRLSTLTYTSHDQQGPSPGVDEHGESPCSPPTHPSRTVVHPATAFRIVVGLSRRYTGGANSPTGAGGKSPQRPDLYALQRAWSRIEGHRCLHPNTQSRDNAGPSRSYCKCITERCSYYTYTHTGPQRAVLVLLDSPTPQSSSRVAGAAYRLTAFKHMSSQCSPQSCCPDPRPWA